MPRNTRPEDEVCEYQVTDRDGFPKLMTKKAVLHGESNAILKLARNGSRSAEGATLYVTMSPCEDCAKLIIQAGIKRVVFRELYRETDGVDFLKEYNVDVVQL
jgi:dCMP deaminase